MIKQFFSILLAAIQVVISMISFSINKDKMLPTDFLEGSSPIAPKSIMLDGKAHASDAFDCVEGSVIEFVFDSPVSVNTAVICESGSSVTEFEIYANGEMIYRQDTIEAMRYCAFESVEAARLAVKICKADSAVKLDSVAFYLINNSVKDDFTVTSYVIADRVYNPESIDRGSFSVITDAILFGVASFDKDGNVYFNSSTIGGEKLDGEQVFEAALSNLRSCGNDKLRIHINFLGPDTVTSGLSWEDSMYEKGELHASAMKDNRKKLIDGIVAILDKYDLDGVFFDYEFPLEKEHWRMYNSFLVSLDAAIGSRQLGIALAPWGVELSPLAAAAVDRIEVMAYDLFDERGYHSSFYSTAQKALIDCEKKGIPKEKLELGIPFYARPIDHAAIWTDYASEHSQLGRFGNLAVGEFSGTAFPRYYNGYQMVYDKTAFAAHYGAMGVMIWHYSCDLPSANALSLFGAMDDAITAR